MNIQVSKAIEVPTSTGKLSTQVTIEFAAEQAPDLEEVLRAVGQALSGANGHAVSPGPSNGHEEAPATPSRPAFTWQKPDLHAKAMKSVHRVVDAIAKAGGNGLSIAEIQTKARISAVPAYKMLKDDHAQGAYAARYLRATKIGRQQVVDLTPEGRQLASLIRAGRVPA